MGAAEFGLFGAGLYGVAKIGAKLLGVWAAAVLLVAVCTVVLTAQAVRPYAFEAAAHPSKTRVPADEAVRKQRLTPARLEAVSKEGWDAIVIGSGMGVSLSPSHLPLHSGL